MFMSEEKVLNFTKLLILFLITLLGVSLTSKMFMVVVLLFYIAFVKD